jgi:monoamine oxidase
MSSNRSGFSAGGSSMTRRQLLQRFGLVGGSSLVMGAMNAWDLLAEPAGPRPILRGNHADTRVIILGAGMSGLVAGYELGKLGYDCRILEARDRVGGLNWTVKRGTEHTEIGPGGEHQVCRFDEGQYLNAGPWRIPHGHEGVIGYCRELGVRLEQYIDDNLVLFSQDPALGDLANRKIYLREVRSDLWGHTAELLAKVVDQGALDSTLGAEDKDRLVRFLVQAGYLSDPDMVYRPDARLRGSEERYDLSTLLRSPFVSQVRSLTAGTGGPDPVFQATGGMAQISAAFERELGEMITRNAAVEVIRQTEDGVRVVYEDTASGARQEVSGDYVICCLPMSIVKELDINLSPEMRDAVVNSSHSSQAKIGLQMKRRFWEEDDGIYGGHLVYSPYSPDAPAIDGAGGGGAGAGGAGNPLPQFSYPSNDYASWKGVLLGFFGNSNIPGLNGEPLVDASVEERIEYVLTHATAVHPQIRQEYENAYAVMWDRIEYSRGAWASNPGPRLEQLSRADGRIYFGSAAVSTATAWLEGAITSAWRTVEALHQRVEQG